MTISTVETKVDLSLGAATRATLTENQRTYLDFSFIRAVEKNNLEEAKAQLNKGADPKTRDVRGDNAVDIARVLHNEQMEKYFDSIGVKGASPIRQFMRTAIDGRATYP